MVVGWQLGGWVLGLVWVVGQERSRRRAMSEYFAVLVWRLDVH